jgi:uncharacterized protein
MRVGLISDTHGLVRAEVIDFLRGSDFIVHAGDIGDPQVLKKLRALAPLTAVRGNNDLGPWAERIPLSQALKAGEVLIYVLHDLADLDVHPAPAEVRVVVSGHSHRPLIKERDGVLYVNPGSAGPRRFKLPIAVGELSVKGNSVRARIAELEIAP